MPTAGGTRRGEPEPGTRTGVGAGAGVPPAPATSGGGGSHRWETPVDPFVAILPLRLFLGVTFVVAGVQKLADPNFFRAASATSFMSQLRAAAGSAAFPALVRLAEHAPAAIGATVAVAEIAVGLGTVCGLWARIAAAGGLVLSLIFFLTISFGAWPYYYGSDIVFVFAWTPLLLAGPGRFAIDTMAAAGRPSAPATAHGVPMTRRSVLSKGLATAVVAAVGLVTAAVAGAIGRTRSSAGHAASAGSATSPHGGTSSAGVGAGGSTSIAQHPGGTSIGPASAVPVGGVETFTDPATNGPAYAVQLSAGQFTARSAICTHQGCTVQFSQQDATFVCPCHGSVYDARTGRVLHGPAPAPLPSIHIAEGPDGNLYVDGA